MAKTKRRASGSRKTKKKVEQSEVYAYFIDRKGKERRYIDENLEYARTVSYSIKYFSVPARSSTILFQSEWALVGIKEAERKSPGTFPNQLYDALRAITIRFLLKNLWLNCVRIFILSQCISTNNWRLSWILHY